MTLDDDGAEQGPAGAGWAWDGRDWARYLQHVYARLPTDECPALLIGEGGASIRIRGHVFVKAGSGPNFLVDAATLLDAEDAAAREGHRVVGLVHQHPDGEGPSAFDAVVSSLWPGAVLLLVRDRPLRCERIAGGGSALGPA